MRAQAQLMPDPTRTRYQSAAIYQFADPGDILTTVNVWGAVRYPGLYEVPEGTHLSTLFSLAGGPAIAERRSREQRTIMLRLIRAGEHRDVVFESVMENEILVADEDPVVREGDVMTVEVVVRQRFSLRDVFPVVAALASATLAIERLSR